jgi:hypothetical protein
MKVWGEAVREAVRAETEASPDERADAGSKLKKLLGDAEKLCEEPNRFLSFCRDLANARDEELQFLRIAETVRREESVKAVKAADALKMAVQAAREMGRLQIDHEAASADNQPAMLDRVAASLKRLQACERKWKKLLPAEVESRRDAYNEGGSLLLNERLAACAERRAELRELETRDHVNVAGWVG